MWVLHGFRGQCSRQRTASRRDFYLEGVCVPDMARRSVWPEWMKELGWNRRRWERQGPGSAGLWATVKIPVHLPAIGSCQRASSRGETRFLDTHPGCGAETWLWATGPTRRQAGSCLCSLVRGNETGTTVEMVKHALLLPDSRVWGDLVSKGMHDNE